jgi:hypothetical protein
MQGNLGNFYLSYDESNQESLWEGDNVSCSPSTRVRVRYQGLQLYSSVDTCHAIFASPCYLLSATIQCAV